MLKRGLLQYSVEFVYVSQYRKSWYVNRSVLFFRKLSAKKSLSITGKYQDFLKKVSCLTVPKKLVVESFCAVFQKIVGNEKFIGQREVSKFFKDSFCCLTVAKNFVGESFCAVFQKTVGNEKFNDQSEISRFF